jgi:uncharacterized protein (TIGR03382 family)
VPAESPYDGGVIEYTTDAGTTWKDVSEIAASSPYNKMLSGAANPLAGRMVFGGINPSYPNADSVTLDLETALANQTLQLRFRVGTEGIDLPTVPHAGWSIDKLAFAGLAGTPFPTQVADPGCSQAKGPATSAGGGGCQAGGAAGGDVVLLIGVLALQRRRRRAALARTAPVNCAR